MTPKPGHPVRHSRSGRPIMALLDLLGRRWSLRILWELHQHAPTTFRELQAYCDEVSPSVLNTRLRELRQAGIVEHASTGYALTPTGHKLVPSLKPLLAWAEEWAKQPDTPAGD